MTDGEVVGQILAGRYRILRRLGSGGMGDVYLGEHIHMRKTFALKVLHRELTTVDEAVKRFEREAIASSRIQHPNVTTATDFGRLEDGSFYLVLEYIDGTPLGRVLERTGALPERRALNIAVQICAALAAAHREGIIHRDLKPDNVMLTTRADDPDFVKVLDFGIAKLHAEVTGQPGLLTQAGAVFGTPEYMSPEQAAGRAVDARADLYALGIVIYEMLTGDPPFIADDLMQLMQLQLTAKAPALPGKISPKLGNLVQRLLEKDPGERPPSAESVEAELRALALESKRVSARRTPRRTPRSARRIARRALRLVLASLPVRSILSFFGYEFRFGGWSLRLWHVLLGAFLLGGVVFARKPPTFRAETGAGSETKQQAASPQEIAQASLRERASRGESPAVSELNELSRESRKASDWLALGLGHAAAGRATEGLAHFKESLKLDATLGMHPELLGYVRDFADDPSHYLAAQEFAKTSLGASGADLLFDVWAAVRDRTDATQHAKELLDDPQLKSSASPALSIALALREAGTCSQIKSLLPRAQEHADERAVFRLRKFQADRGCGLLGLQDCYGCLRRDRALKQALSAAVSRPLPKFEVPGARGGGLAPPP